MTDAPPPLTRGEARERADLVHDVRYRIELDVSCGPDWFVSSCTISFSCRRPGEATFLEFRTDEVREVEVNGVPLAPETLTGGRLPLDNLREQNVVRVVGRCAYSRNGEGLHRVEDERGVTLYTQLQPAYAHHVFAAFDQPDLKARFQWTLRTPPAWTVVSNTPLANNDPRVRIFEPTPALPTSVVSIAAGDLAVTELDPIRSGARHLPLRIISRPDLHAFAPLEDLRSTVEQGIAYYEGRFGQPYPFTKLDLVFLPEFNAGAMENAAAIAFDEDEHLSPSAVSQAGRQSRAQVLLHELAHMWFGDLVTMRWWDDLWLNEAFAELLSYEALSEATAWRDGWVGFATMDKSWASWQDQYPTTHPIATAVETAVDAETSFDGITYAKGASVLRSLEALIGREAFNRALRTYFVRHAWGSAELADLVAAMQEQTSHDLDQWTGAWLHQAGIGTVRARRVTTDEGDVLQLDQAFPVSLTVRAPQSLTATAYRLDTGRLRPVRTEQLEIGAAAVHSAPLPPETAAVLLNGDDAAYLRLRLDERSIAALVPALSSVESALERAVTWNALWDATRDADLDLATFVHLFERNILHETSATLSALTYVLRPAFRELVPSTARRHTAQSGGDLLLRLVSAAPPDGDHRRQLAHAAADLCLSPAARAWAADLLDGGAGALSDDAELRWDVIVGLAAGSSDRDETARRVETERRSVPSALAAVRGRQALAAVAHPDAKADAWRAVDSGQLSNAESAWLIRGFRIAWDSALLDPFVDPFFERLPEIWRAGSFEIGRQMMKQLFPFGATDGHDVLARSRALLGRGVLPAPGTRLLIESIDDLERMIRVRRRTALAG
ncbi:aminopeptidase N [Rathayibacter iranicus]|uniref:Aminopeptidase N n=2 Tax=Rathayibacter iranicus TaxID=59737 RepID=A0AAD1EMF3_9MICO|nr:aminopeptidase N [Rathayibacter iranicus]AZZ55680.1 aminopeptidase N [Rathayibacter iranicus]MWV31160.1 aminopeptidase N [Rathayibacter iranicus NCPPB 2253 = VKM Ac-1602]PPI47802.1 aminopeptidase N [Rathayibacter iranicus]PPI61100.1 aminopeptidase N [Rathayibacter iranicus]PPI72924.1 aminopeptidase N [Rathayibacter iranicus]